MRPAGSSARSMFVSPITRFDASEANAAVLAHQLRTEEPLADEDDARHLLAEIGDEARRHDVTHADAVVLAARRLEPGPLQRQAVVAQADT